MSGTVELWIWIGVLVVVVGVGGYVLEKWRRLSSSDRSGPQDWLGQFREMHSQGLLSDQEFRTIKTTLLPQIQQEIDHQLNKDKPAE